MIEQEIVIHNGQDPFDTKTIKVKIPKKTKILSTEPYALELLSLYGIESLVEDNSKLCETNQEYITKGEIISITKDSEGNKINALIDIDSKYTASCSLLKETDEIISQLEEGMYIDVKIKTTKRGLVTASISDAIDEVKFNEILNSINDKTVAFNGKIVELINGGYWVDLGGIKCFMPGSLAGLNKLYDFNSLVGKDLIVMPLSYSQEKNSIIVSHRAYLKTLVYDAIEDLSKNIKMPLTGFVTGTAKFGVFAEFNKCLTGMIPINELDKITLSKFEKNEIRPGDEIMFWTKEIIGDKKIILSQHGPVTDEWDNIEDVYTPMMITDGVVTKITTYGAFVELQKGISGLIHKTRYKDINTLNKGDVVKVKIHSISTDDKKIVMSIAD